MRFIFAIWGDTCWCIFEFVKMWNFNWFQPIFSYLTMGCLCPSCHKKIINLKPNKPRYRSNPKIMTKGCQIFHRKENPSSQFLRKWIITMFNFFQKLFFWKSWALTGRLTSHDPDTNWSEVCHGQNWKQDSYWSWNEINVKFRKSMVALKKFRLNRKNPPIFNTKFSQICGQNCKSMPDCLTQWHYNTQKIDVIITSMTPIMKHQWRSIPTMWCAKLAVQLYIEFIACRWMEHPNFKWP